MPYKKKIRLYTETNDQLKKKMSPYTETNDTLMTLTYNDIVGPKIIKKIPIKDLPLDKQVNALHSVIVKQQTQINLLIEQVNKLMNK